MSTTTFKEAGKPQVGSIEEIMSGGKNELPKVKEMQAETPEVDAGTGNQEVKPEGGEQDETQAGQPVSEQVEQKETEKTFEITDEELKKLYEQKFGKQEVSEEKEELKAKEEKEIEKKVVDLWISQNANLDDLVGLKKVANMDELEVAKAVITEDLKAKGLSDNEVKEVIEERFYLVDVDSLEQGEFETDEEFEERKEKIRKKAQLGEADLKKIGEEHKNRAKSILDNLRKTVEQLDALANTDNEYTAKVEKLSEVLPRKMTLQLGKLENEELSPIEIDVPNEAIESIVSQLKDRANFEKQYFNEDGTPKVEPFAELLVKNAILEKTAREAYMAGRTEQVKKLEEVFPTNSPQELGVGNVVRPVRMNKYGKPALKERGKVEPVNVVDYKQIK